MASTGGAFGYSAGGGSPALTPLLGYVQGMNVTDQGPVWDVLPRVSKTLVAAASLTTTGGATAVVRTAVAMTASPVKAAAPGAQASDTGVVVTSTGEVPVNAPALPGIPAVSPGSHGRGSRHGRWLAAAWARRSTPGQPVASTDRLAATSLLESHGAIVPGGARGLHQRRR
jgi:hypothetical protein